MCILQRSSKKLIRSGLFKKRLLGVVLCVALHFTYALEASPYFTLNSNDLKSGVKLDGTCEFYWLTDYVDFKTPTQQLTPQLINLPNNWCAFGFPPKGYGLFRLNLVLPKNTNTPLGLTLPSICNAYNLYIDGVKIHSAGVFSKSESTAVADYLPGVITFTPQRDTVEIAFEICNYFYREGGIYYSLKLGEAKTETKKFYSALFTSAFIAGALLLMTFYFIVIFVVRRVEKAALYFALLCLVAGIRVCTTDGILFKQINLPISWDWLVKLELGSIILVPTFGALFLFHLLKEKKYRIILNSLNVISAGMLLFVLFTPTFYSSHIVPPFRYFAFIEILFVFFVVAVNLFNNNNLLSKLAAAGYFVVFIFGINDILYSKGVIDSVYLLPFGIFGFVIIQAILLAKRFAKSYTDVEILSDSLKALNKNQELIIESRTSELAQKTKDLEKYNAIKDKIFAIIAHDLKAPIASFRTVITLAEIGNNNDITEIRKFFNSLKPNVDNLTLTIDNLLMWSQSQLNGTFTNPSDIRVLHEINKVKELYKLVAELKSISIIIDVDDKLLVKADLAHFEIILRNLVNNAIKFTTVSGLVKISAKPVAKNQVLIEVVDNGVGIESEQLHLMFDENVHFTSYGTKNESGTGLGLKMCKAFIEQNGGSIHISSQLNIGTKIGFTLPQGLA